MFSMYAHATAGVSISILFDNFQSLKEILMSSSCLSVNVPMPGNNFKNLCKETDSFFRSRYFLRMTWSLAKSSCRGKSCMIISGHLHCLRKNKWKLRLIFDKVNYANIMYIFIFGFGDKAIYRTRARIVCTHTHAQKLKHFFCLVLIPFWEQTPQLK